MPAHDWTRVDASVFHDFHNVWIALLRNALNSGALPKGYYAMSEQHGGKYLADVLTLHQPPPPEALAQVRPGGVAVDDAPPAVRHRLAVSPTTRALRKTLTIRHVADDRIVALLEIISPANKDRKKSVEQILNKLEDALAHGIHLVIVDIIPAGRHDPRGIPGALLQRLGEAAESPPADEPLTVASFVADTPIVAYWEHVGYGRELPDMPLFLNADYYIKTPLEATYMGAWQGTPERFRLVLEKPSGAARRKRGK
jgi:Protein of unknown function (DUF4058)